MLIDTGSQNKNTVLVSRECRELFLTRKNLLEPVFEEFGIHITGISHLKSPYKIMRWDQDYHLVIFSRQGDAYFTVNGETLPFKRNHYWVVPAGCHHNYFTDASWSMMFFHLENTSRWSFLKDLRYIQQPSEWYGKIHETLRGAFSETNRGGSDSMVATESYARLMGIYLDRELMKENDETNIETRQRIEELWIQVQQKLHHKWNVEELANMAHVSSVHLHRLVQKFYGTTPMGMVFKLRMHRAEDLLLHSNYPLKLVAHLVGYEGPFAFSKAFKRYSEMNPQEFRRKR